MNARDTVRRPAVAPASLDALARSVGLHPEMVARLAACVRGSLHPFREAVDPAMELLGGVIPEWPLLAEWNRWCLATGARFFVWQPERGALLDRTRFEALLHTIMMVAAKEEAIRAYAASGVREAQVVMAGDDCPVCDEHRHRVVPLGEAATTGALPPFHPGCRCGFLPRLDSARPARRPSADPILALLEASRRRRSIAAEAFRATLAGLEGVHVEVEPVNADAERDGLTRGALRADAESALREAGMAVYTQGAVLVEVPGMPVLHVDVMTIHLDGRYAYSVRLELWQVVRLMRAPGIAALALTWSAPQVIGTVAAERVAEVREIVRAEVTAFVQECRGTAIDVGRDAAP
jgi:hypothetical protein